MSRVGSKQYADGAAAGKAPATSALPRSPTVNPLSQGAPRLSSQLRQLTKRRQSLGRGLFTLARIYDAMVLQDIHAAGYTDIRPVHTNILRAVDVGGTRLTDVASTLNITKQATGQVVKELVELGYMSLLTVPHDTRVRMVVFTERGMSLLLHIGETFGHIDRHLAELVGEKALQSFREQLEQMIRGSKDLV